MACGISTAVAESNWSFHSWQSDEGLPNNNVTSIAQSADGYLWIANPSRLARFDGVRFGTVATGSIVPETYEKITTLLRSKKGGLWAGMSHGTVVYLDGHAPKIFTNSLSKGYVESLVEDKDGALWISFSDDVVGRIQNGTVTRFGTADGLVANYVCWFACDSKGQLWFAKANQAGIFRNGRFHVLYELKEPFNGLTAAAAGGVWLVSGGHLFHSKENGGLHDCGAFVSHELPPQPSPILEDSDGSVWIGTSDNGLFRYDGTNFEGVPVSHGEISCLLKDDENNLWVGTGGGGINRVNRRAIELETTENGLPFEAVQSLCEDPDGTLWATTQNGFVVCRSNDFWNVIITNRDYGGMASCITGDTNGAIWIGTHSHMLDYWHDGEMTTFGKSDGLSSRIIHTLLVSKSGDIFIGGEKPDAIQRLRNGKFFTFKIPPGTHIIRAMVEDNSGNIWVGTSRGNLLRLSGDHAFDETTNVMGGPMSIRCLHVTSDGALWFGFAGFGIGRLKDGHLSRISVDQGLFDYNVSQIVPDDRGWMWFGADHGLFKARQSDLDAVADGRAASAQFIHYGRDEDLPSLQANFGDSPGALRSRDGKMWIPMRTALAVIDPDKISENRAPAEARLESVIVDDQIAAAYGGLLPVRDAENLRNAGSKLRLPPGHHRVEFDFTAPNFTAPENVRFRYRLDGFDKHWMDAGAQRSATYILPTGSYTFEVAACNSDGIWGKTQAPLALSVAPFFWQTWWFNSVAILIFTLAVIGIVRYVSFRRLRAKLQLLEHQAELHRERARIARDLHDDLGTRLTKIILLSGLAKRDLSKPERAGDHVEKISTAARGVVKSLDETVWAVNPRNDNLPHLISYVGQFAVEFLQTADIRCRADLPEHPPRHGVPAKMRHHLFLAVKEALNNIVRHSNAKEVRLQVVADEHILRVTLEDDGYGVGKLEDNGCADGLQNMRKRMEEIGGDFKFESTPGTGTRISFVCPWRNGD